jgi:hypothetical protein
MSTFLDTLQVTLANGVSLHRGEEIVVGYRSEVRTAFVDRIGFSDNHHYITLQVMMGSGHAGQANHPHPDSNETYREWHYIQARHVDAVLGGGRGGGLRFVTVKEGDAALARLRAWMSDQAQKPDQPDFKPTDGADFHPADTDQSGAVSDKEWRQWSRSEQQAGRDPGPRPTDVGPRPPVKE